MYGSLGRWCLVLSMLGLLPGFGVSLGHVCLRYPHSLYLCGIKQGPKSPFYATYLLHIAEVPPSSI